jgi:dihydropteroate synthase
VPVMELHLGERVLDTSRRAVVVGILNRTRDSFYDGGQYFALDALLRHADRLVSDGADVLEVGARPGGVGVRDVPADQEAALVGETLSELRRRFDVPLAVDTTRASVAATAFSAGAVLGNDMSGFRDPDYLGAAAAAGASVVATHTRLPPGVPDPDPRFGDVVGEVAHEVRAVAEQAVRAGLPRERVVLDPGLDLGKTWQQSLELVAATSTFAAMGFPLLLGASNKIFLGRALGGLEKDRRDVATAAVCALAVAVGARVLRVHDARIGRQTGDLAVAVTEAAAGSRPQGDDGVRRRFGGAGFDV